MNGHVNNGCQEASFPQYFSAIEQKRTLVRSKRKQDRSVKTQNAYVEKYNASNVNYTIERKYVNSWDEKII